MCGRYTLAASQKNLIADYIAEMGGVAPPPRYNIAPSQPVLAVRQESYRERDWALMEWGLIPGWVKYIQRANRSINARAETAADKASFRGPIRYRRCILPASGFYEWKRRGKERQPYYITPSDRETFAFAGIYEVYEGAEGSYLETCAILTTSPNELMAQIHDRMPVILDPTEFDDWLDPQKQRPQDIAYMLKSYPSERMKCYPVSPLVNSVHNDGEDLAAKLEDFPLPTPTQGELF